MIKLGICTGLENAPIAAAAGFDYIETALNALAAMGPEGFARAKDAWARAGLPCEAVNCMLPGNLRVTGPGVDLGRAREYLQLSFGRARELGARLVVFGSGASRGVPAGTPHWLAWQQLREFLLLAGPLAKEYGLKIAIEPLSREECNIINYVSEALALAALLDLPEIGVLGDTYHMYQNNEPLAAFAQAGSHLLHVHTACPQGRAFPSPGDPACQRGEYRQLFAILDRAGYDGRVSIEGSSRDLAEDARKGFLVLDELRRQADKQETAGRFGSTGQGLTT